MLIVDNFTNIVYKGKSTKEGVLVTQNCFKFTKNNWSKDGKTYWYRCSTRKAIGCPATATIKRLEEEDTDGNIVVKCYMTEVSTPEVSRKEVLGR